MLDCGQHNLLLSYNTLCCSDIGRWQDPEWPSRCTGWHLVQSLCLDCIAGRLSERSPLKLQVGHIELSQSSMGFALQEPPANLGCAVLHVL